MNHPLDGKLVVLTGGSGFLGRHVAQALLERGARLRIASREPKKAFSLRPLANLGQIEFLRCDVRDAAQAAAAVRGADAVVNLVGSFEGDLMKLICGGALHVAEAARDEGVGAMVHVSAIGPRSIRPPNTRTPRPRRRRKSSPPSPGRRSCAPRSCSVRMRVLCRCLPG